MVPAAGLQPNFMCPPGMLTRLRDGGQFLVFSAALTNPNPRAPKAREKGGRYEILRKYPRSVSMAIPAGTSTASTVDCSRVVSTFNRHYGSPALGGLRCSIWLGLAGFISLQSNIRTLVEASWAMAHPVLGCDSHVQRIHSSSSSVYS